MNLAYLKDSDTLYLEISPEDPDHTWEAHPGVILNLSKDGRLVGVELQHASETSDLSALRIGGFPGEIEVKENTARGVTH